MDWRANGTSNEEHKAQEKTGKFEHWLIAHTPARESKSGDVVVHETTTDLAKTLMASLHQTKQTRLATKIRDRWGTWYLQQCPDAWRSCSCSL